MKIDSKWAYYEQAADERAAAFQALENVRAETAETIHALEKRYDEALEDFKLARIEAYKEKLITWE